MNKIKVGNIPIHKLFIYNGKFWRSERMVLLYDWKVIQYKGKKDQDGDYMKVLRTVNKQTLIKN